MQLSGKASVCTCKTSTNGLHKCSIPAAEGRVTRISASDAAVRYQVLGKLQDTIYGQCVLAQDKKTKTLVAIKQSSFQRIAQADLPESPLQECKLLRTVGQIREGGHPNVLKVVDEFAVEEMHWAVLEYMDKGDLFTLIQRHGKRKEAECKSIILQLTDAVQYLHDCGVAHLDIKPENILLAGSQRIKLCDFGTARSVAECRYVDGKVTDMSAQVPSFEGRIGTVWTFSICLTLLWDCEPCTDCILLSVVVIFNVCLGHVYGAGGLGRETLQSFSGRRLVAWSCFVFHPLRLQSVSETG
jgi:serine/threonine protein kinase